MYALAAPIRDDDADFITVSSRRARATREVLTTIGSRVKDAYASYETRWSLRPAAPDTTWTASESAALRSNYNLLQRPFREIRDELLRGAPQRICPMCGHREVATLDHYLPKSQFPEFSILSRNLVPCCPQCNHKKREKTNEATGRFFHPYYDEPPHPSSLVATVSFVGGIGVTYSIVGPPDLDDETLANLRFHFRELDLADCYSAAAIQELFDRLEYFRVMLEATSPEWLSDDLRREAQSVISARGVNHWKSALYRALSSSDDLLSGRFVEHLPHHVTAPRED